MPTWFRLINSPGSDSPSPSTSRQIRSSANRASWLVIWLSLLLSSFRSSSYPDVVGDPKSSVIPSIRPLPSRSRASSPSLGLTQPVRSRNPSLSRSKNADDLFNAVSSIPSPSRSITSGSIGRGLNSNPSGLSQCGLPSVKSSHAIPARIPATSAAATMTPAGAAIAVAAIPAA